MINKKKIKVFIKYNVSVLVSTDIQVLLLHLLKKKKSGASSLLLMMMMMLLDQL